MNRKPRFANHKLYHFTRPDYTGPL